MKSRYDILCGTPNGTMCTVNLTIPEKMVAPIYFYYQLTNFYQNHRRYVKSRADSQLQGDLSGSTSACDPLINGGPNSLPIYPCGLIANSFFNDNFTAYSCTSNDCNMLSGSNWQKQGIAWESDVSSKFVLPSNLAASLPSLYTLDTRGNKLPSMISRNSIFDSRCG